MIDGNTGSPVPKGKRGKRHADGNTARRWADRLVGLLGDVERVLRQSEKTLRAARRAAFEGVQIGKLVMRVIAGSVAAVGGWTLVAHVLGRF